MHTIAIETNLVAMWVTFALIFSALVLYALEKLPVEITSLSVLCAFMIYFHIFPINDDNGRNLLRAGS